jgi:hypothetical protein
MPLGFSLEEYVMRADSEKAAVLRDQWSEAVECGSIHCTCGLQRALPLAYRCLYCGQYFCGPCAEKHFGQTLQEWIEAKRIEKRRELEQRHNAKLNAKLNATNKTNPNMTTFIDGKTDPQSKHPFDLQPYEVIRLMITGLRHAYVKMDMHHFYGVDEHGVCVDCAATNALCEIVGKPMPVTYNISMEGHKQWLERECPKYSFSYKDVCKFEGAVDSLRLKQFYNFNSYHPHKIPEDLIPDLFIRVTEITNDAIYNKNSKNKNSKKLFEKWLKAADWLEKEMNK